MPTVMVVDDDFLNRELMEGILTAFDFRPVLAHSGEMALELIAAERPALILVDVRMPDMDGFALCQAIKAQDSALPVLLITGNAIQADEVKKAESVGADDLIERGLTMEHLVEAIRRLL